MATSSSGWPRSKSKMKLARVGDRRLCPVGQQISAAHYFDDTTAAKAVLESA
jgi:hypothetical protein